MRCLYISISVTSNPPPGDLLGLQHSLAESVVKKEPMTIEMIEVVVRDIEQSGSLSDLRFATACVLGMLDF